MIEDAQLVNNEQARQFEMMISGCRCFIDYKSDGEKIYLNHTEVPQELSGKGIAALLVTKTFQYLENRGIKAVPGCSYIQHFLQRNPDWMRIVYKH